MTGPVRVDVVIVGSGLAGLTLARHLLLETDRSVLVLDRRVEQPPRPKVGESTVQLGGWYFAKVLQLEELLLREHYLKYNLRFYWPPLGVGSSRFEEYHQSYLTEFSNVPTFQIDRNRFEAALLALNLAEPRFERMAPVRDLRIELDPTGPHGVSFDGPHGHQEVAADWVVDASGRNRVLTKQLGLERKSPIRHGASFLWVDGRLDVERLTDRSQAALRNALHRRDIGHAPLWLATNHFCREGLWLWVIPLHGATSLGVVFDGSVLDFSEVASGPLLREWICRTFPLFSHDLPRRRILAHSGFRDFALDCSRAISGDRWGLTGEAGRFLDPLYSSGTDFIAVHNTLLVNAMQARDPAERLARCRRHDLLARVLYEGFVPGFTTGYAALGDQEAFTLKYAWELSVYFSFYVFPFINGLFTSARFVPPFLDRFSRLGAVNRGLQEVLTGFARWKRMRPPPAAPVRFELSRLPALSRALENLQITTTDEKEALAILDAQIEDCLELARFVAAHVAAVVAGDPAAVHSREFVEGIDLQRLAFDPEAMPGRRHPVGDRDRPWRWGFDPAIFEPFRPPAAEGTASVATGDLGE